MASNDSISKTLTVATVLCIVCAVVVSMAAVNLRPMQEANKAKDFKRNILMAAGMYQEDVPVDDQFSQIDVKVVDLETGQYATDIDVESYDQRKASKDPKQSESLTKEQDIAGLGRLEAYANVFLVTNPDGTIEKVILPIRGYGLWSTMRGFIALKKDLNTVVGLGYYEHGETPGLGGEIDNPKWKAIWPGKKIYDDNGEVSLAVVKGAVDKSLPDAEYKVDGLSGATLTSNGVDNMIEFWLGENGFGPFLTRLKNGGA